MTATDEGSLEHVHAKYGWFREVKRRDVAEALQREDLADLIHDGYYNED